MAALLLVVLLLVHMFVFLHGDQPLVLPAPTAKPNCTDSCGGIKVPYPFGIGINCSFHEHFNLACNNSANPPNLLWGNIQVLDVNILEGEMSVNLHIIYECFDRTGTAVVESFRIASLSESLFTFSARRNMFTIIGCDTSGTFTGFLGKNFTTGCISICTDDKSLTNGTCDGIGCCQTAIPKGVRKMEVKLSSIDNYREINRKEDFACGYAFLVDKRKFNFSISDVYGTEFRDRRAGVAPVVLDWALGSETNRCESSEANRRVCVDGECYNSPDGSGFRCRCKKGYHGNPYLLHGCVGKIH